MNWLKLLKVLTDPLKSNSTNPTPVKGTKITSKGRRRRRERRRRKREKGGKGGGGGGGGEGGGRGGGGGKNKSEKERRIECPNASDRTTWHSSKRDIPPPPPPRHPPTYSSSPLPLPTPPPKVHTSSKSQTVTHTPPPPRETKAEMPPPPETKAEMPPSHSPKFKIEEIHINRNYSIHPKIWFNYWQNAHQLRINQLNLVIETKWNNPVTNLRLKGRNSYLINEILELIPCRQVSIIKVTTPSNRPTILNEAKRYWNQTSEVKTKANWLNRFRAIKSPLGFIESSTTLSTLKSQPELIIIISQQTGSLRIKHMSHLIPTWIE